MAIKWGIIQGRLTQSPPNELQWFPSDTWDQEFQSAASLGFDYIEFISERNYNPHNPIWTENGVKQITTLLELAPLSPYSHCDDTIITHSFIKNAYVFEQLQKLIQNLSKIQICKLILPFFEASEITPCNKVYYQEKLLKLSSFSNDYNVQICIETSLNGQDLLSFMTPFKNTSLTTVYDTGNSIGFEHDIYNDILLLKDHITHVHLKDRDIEKNNVLLGTGCVDFKQVFKSLQKINYKNAFTFETTRGKDPIQTAKNHLAFIKKTMKGLNYDY